MTNPGIAARIAASADHAIERTCPRCSAPILTAWAGRTAALHVTADPTPVNLPGEIQARTEGRLTWRLLVSTLGVRRIVWRDPLTVPHHTHPVLRDHRCPPQPVQEALL
ncbi:hypothetical protein J7F03_20625 [Streptomyces sp. ISL-43]|uniref:hypothetical protein n=1 Tax=Streptomyces sp. ISL-43 TaxID=2819183 RepID=UPI001BED1D53|nr:hypothetical protein [Streptomyces sp. ISL-43]MBT2449449.1 hypothetical protein [Streptomyces sp. ISL-43]